MSSFGVRTIHSGRSQLVKKDDPKLRVFNRDSLAMPFMDKLTARLLTYSLDKLSHLIFSNFHEFIEP